MLYFIFLLAVWPSLFHIKNLVFLNPPERKRTLLDYLMISPIILVFDRPPYFGRMTFQVHYSNGQEEQIQFNSDLYAKLKPFPVGAHLTRALARVWMKKEALEALDLIFCQRKFEALGISANVDYVDYQLEYQPKPSATYPPLRIKCQR